MGFVATEALTIYGIMKALVNKVKILLGLSIFVAVSAVFSLSTGATSSGSGGVQAYSAESPIDVGTIVVLAAKNSNQVKAASKNEAQNMFGVVVDRNQLPLALSNEGIVNETFVASSGTYTVVVSTQGGTIAAGDYVALSSINGVAMKASSEEKTVFGRAVSGFDGKGVVIGTTTLKDKTGKESKTVTLGSVPITIDIRKNPNEKTTKANVPEFLERTGQAIAEKPVSPVRIYLSTAIVLLSLIMAIVVIYAGIRNGVISIGRNPMSKKSIFRAMIEVILTSALILIIGLFAVYLLLKL